MMSNRIIVAGAGASGIMAAIAAARQGASVTLLEAMERPGKKLLLTGNGRCNLTNLDPSLPEKYFGSGSKVAKTLTRQAGASFTRSFFSGLGLLTTAKGDYVYPYCGQSQAVLSVLLCELRRLGVKLKCKEKVTGLYYSEGAWHVKTETWTYQADSVILSCGSMAAPATGSDGSGYLVAEDLGHTVLSPAPALVPVICEGSFLQQLFGVRCRAKVSLMEHTVEGRALLGSETGELQWTKYGVSGIVVFQLSRFISTHPNQKALRFHLDLLPDFEEEELAGILEKRRKEIPNERIAVLLSGMLNEKLTGTVLSRTGIPPKTMCGAVPERQIFDLIRNIKDFSLKIKGTKSFDVSQVCAGGIDCREINPKTLESRLHSGVYFTGELLDVDGPCGGYNLQWAWSSGYIAGCAAAKKESRSYDNSDS